MHKRDRWPKGRRRRRSNSDRVIYWCKYVTNTEPEISFNALTVTTSPQTKRIQGRIKRQSLVVLVDSRSTHNFLNLQVATWLGSSLQKNGELRVTVANGEWDPSESWYVSKSPLFHSTIWVHCWFLPIRIWRLWHGPWTTVVTNLMTYFVGFF